MHRCTIFALVLCMSAQPLTAGPGNIDDPCLRDGAQDSWTFELEPGKTDEYIFTYTNNISECSEGFDKGLKLTAKNGFVVYMYVTISVNENEDEYIYLVPEDPQYMTYPPDLTLPDSSTPGTIKVFPGIM